MKITWDAKAKAVYMILSNKPVCFTESREGWGIDFDWNGQVVGIKILNVDSKPEVVEL